MAHAATTPTIQEDLKHSHESIELVWPVYVVCVCVLGGVLSNNLKNIIKKYSLNVHIKQTEPKPEFWIQPIIYIKPYNNYNSTVTKYNRQQQRGPTNGNKL